MKEMWKAVKGYEGLYDVSNFGRVRSLINNKILKPDIGLYKVVTLYKNKQRKRFYIHRLVAFSFIENKENKPMVNHIDGNKLNNNVSNLEWCTCQENNKHAFLKGLNKGSYGMLGKTGKLNKKSKIVLQYDLDGNFIKEWYGLSEIERKLNISSTNIWACCKGKRKKSKGYIWKYKEEI